MNLESQVVNLELSKKLKELGIKQESLFYWEEIEELDGSSINNIAYIPRWPKVNFVNESFINGGKLKFYSAFTASELLELLPKEISFNKLCHYLVIETTGTGWWSYYRQHSENEFIPVSSANENLCETLAKMLIYLIENVFLDTNHVIPPNAFDLIMKEIK